MSIHNHEDHTLRRVEIRISEAVYPGTNRNLILFFESFLFAEGLKTARVLKYMLQMNTVATMVNEATPGKEFLSMNRMDVQSLVAKIERSDRAAWTKRDYKITIKRFFSWLNTQDAGVSIDVKWINIGLKVSQQKLPEELITEEEIKLMIEAANHPRDKAIIAVLYDAGDRIGEHGSLKIKHATFDQYGGILMVSGKTGMRRVRIVFSVPYLTAWIDIHPGKNDPDSWIWVPLRGKGAGKAQMQYHAFRKIITEAAAKAGIKKRIHPHLFRHSRSTELAQYLTESQMEEHLGWIHGSAMPATYVHLSGKQIDDAVLSIYGKKRREEMRPELTSRTCPRCEKENGPTSKFCARCGLPLDMKTMQEMQGYEEDFKKVYDLLRKIKEEGL